MSWGLGYCGRSCIEKASVQKMKSTHCCHLLSTYYASVFYAHANGFLKSLSHAKGMTAFSTNLLSLGWESSSGSSCVISPWGKIWLLFPPHGFPANSVKECCFWNWVCKWCAQHEEWKGKRGEKGPNVSTSLFQPARTMSRVCTSCF